MSSHLEGGCLCGAVRYRLESSPLFVNCCHCRDCQRQTGSAFALNAFIEATRLTLVAGEPVTGEMTTPSGRRRRIFRCPTCLVAMWHTSMPGLHLVRVATLDQPAALTPDAHIYCRSKLPWVQIPADVPQFEVVYDLAALWPAESQARRLAAMG